jgi:hypothetical protein
LILVKVALPATSTPLATSNLCRSPQASDAALPPPPPPVAGSSDPQAAAVSASAATPRLATRLRILMIWFPFVWLLVRQRADVSA